MNVLFNTNIKAKIEKKVDKYIKDNPDTRIVGYSVKFVESYLYVKLNYTGNPYSSNIYAIQGFIQELVEGLSYTYKGVNVYLDNKEICLTFEENKQ